MSKTGRARLGWFCGFCLLLLIEGLIALFVHDRFVRPYLGDVLAVWVVYCFARLFCPRAPVFGLRLFVLCFAELVEFSQLFGLARRLHLAAGSAGAILLGGTFDFADLLCYAVGYALLGLVESAERRYRSKTADT